MRNRLAFCCLLAATSLSACGTNTSAPLLPAEGARFDNGGSLGGGGRSDQSLVSVGVRDTNYVRPLSNGGSLGGGGR